MIRNLKVLGLAIVAVFALSAVVASVAAAQQGLFTSDGPVTMTAEETGISKNWFKGFGAKIECPGTTYTGHKVLTAKQTEEGKKHEFLPKGVTEATVTPHYKETTGGKPNCVVPGISGTATIDMNGCDYVIHIGETTPGVDTYSVTIDIVCPVGKQIEITLWNNAHTNATFCSIDLPAQNGLKGAHLTDTTNGHVDVTGIIKGITATQTKHGSGVLCPHQETKEAEFEIDVTTKGHNEAGGATSVGLSHN